MRYKVRGVDRNTGAVREPLEIAAFDESDALRQAVESDLLVESVEQIVPTGEVVLDWLWVLALPAVAVVVVSTFFAQGFNFLGYFGGSLIFLLATIAGMDVFPEQRIRLKEIAYLTLLLGGVILITRGLCYWLCLTHSMLTIPLPERFSVETMSRFPPMGRVISQALVFWGCIVVGGAVFDIRKKPPMIDIFLSIIGRYLYVLAMFLLGHAVYSFAVIEGSPTPGPHTIYVGFSSIEVLGSFALFFGAIFVFRPSL